MPVDLHKKALFLSYFTVGYNILEGIASILAGSLTDSIALIGFGLDSFVESSSGFIMIWRLGKHGKISEEEEKKIEKKAWSGFKLPLWAVAGRFNRWSYYCDLSYKRRS